jgi:hypothetical protein
MLEPAYFAEMYGARPEEGPLQDHYDRLLAEHNERAERMQRVMGNQVQREQRDALRRQQRATLQAAQAEVVRHQAAQLQQLIARGRPDTRRAPIPRPPVPAAQTELVLQKLLAGRVTKVPVARKVVKTAAPKVTKAKAAPRRPKVAAEPTEPTRKSVREVAPVIPNNINAPAKKAHGNRGKGKRTAKKAVVVEKPKKVGERGNAPRSPRVVIKRRRVVFFGGLLMFEGSRGGRRGTDYY